MFDHLFDSIISGDIELLSKKFDKPKKVYRRNVEQSNRVSKEVEKFNNGFSETFFTSWIRNIFLRYSYLVSENDPNKIARFEKIHCLEGSSANKEDLTLYMFFKFVNVNFIDLVEFNHNPSTDIINLKLSVTCTGILGKKNQNSPIEEQRSFNYDIEFVKQNEKTKNSKVEDFTSNCPNCGAPTNITTYGVCDHCKEIVSIYDNLWKIRKLSLDE